MKKIVSTAFIMMGFLLAGSEKAEAGGFSNDELAAKSANSTNIANGANNVDGANNAQEKAQPDAASQGINASVQQGTNESKESKFKKMKEKAKRLAQDAVEGAAKGASRTGHAAAAGHALKVDFDCVKQCSSALCGDNDPEKEKKAEDCIIKCPKAATIRCRAAFEKLHGKDALSHLLERRHQLLEDYHAETATQSSGH